MTYVHCRITYTMQSLERYIVIKHVGCMMTEEEEFGQRHGNCRLNIHSTLPAWDKPKEKPHLSFSIEHILTTTCSKTKKNILASASSKSESEYSDSFQHHVCCDTNTKQRGLFDETTNYESNRPDFANYPKFDWLQCTRYKPPKVTRAKRKKIIATRSNRQPRIPFSPFQQATLENQFRLNQYLTSHLLNELSSILKLSKQRIKIWYQNRRARDRRDEQIKESQET